MDRELVEEALDNMLAEATQLMHEKIERLAKTPGVSTEEVSEATVQAMQSLDMLRETKRYTLGKLAKEDEQ